MCCFLSFFASNDVGSSMTSNNRLHLEDNKFLRRAFIRFVRFGGMAGGNVMLTNDEAKRN